MLTSLMSGLICSDRQLPFIQVYDTAAAAVRWNGHGERAQHWTICLIGNSGCLRRTRPPICTVTPLHEGRQKTVFNSGQSKPSESIMRLVSTLVEPAVAEVVELGVAVAGVAGDHVAADASGFQQGVGGEALFECAEQEVASCPNGCAVAAGSTRRLLPAYGVGS